MTLNSFSNLLRQWQDHSQQQAQKLTRQVSYYAADDARIHALAETFALPPEEIMAGLLHQALLEVEEKMPYVPGSRVIRVEEGANVYEDVGPMPKYLESLQKLRSR